MKKFSIIFISAVIFLLTCGFDKEHRKVYDDAGLLTTSEIELLQAEAVALASKYELDIGIVTTSDTGGKDTINYADDFYDYNGFGYEKEMGTGILLLIDMEHRQVFVTTSGEAIERFSEQTTDAMVDKIAPYLTDTDYVKACETFLTQVEYYSKNESLLKPLNIPSGKSMMDIIKMQPIYILIAAVCSGIIVLIIVSGHKTKMTANSGTYLANNKFDLRVNQDQFTHTTTVSRRIPKNDSNNGGGGGRTGGGSRTGSSGNRHGGSGRSF